MKFFLQFINCINYYYSDLITASLIGCSQSANLNLTPMHIGLKIKMKKMLTNDNGRLKYFIFFSFVVKADDNCYCHQLAYSLHSDKLPRFFVSLALSLKDESQLEILHELFIRCVLCRFLRCSAHR